MADTDDVKTLTDTRIYEVAEVRLQVPDDGGAYPGSDAVDSPRVFGFNGASGLSGLAAGSLILDSQGEHYKVNSSGAPVLVDAGLTANLASTSNGAGASLVGVEDAAGDFTGADVEAVLAELGAVRTYSATGTIPGGDGAGNAGDLNSSPVELVAAPGAGLYIHVLEVHYFLDYESAAYDGTKTGNLTTRFTDGSGDEVVGQVAETGFMDQTADVHAVVTPVDYVPVANAAIVAASDNDWYSAAGDSPVKYEVLYQIRPFDPTA